MAASLKSRVKSISALLGSKRSASQDEIPQDGDSPEANAARGVRLFCESAAANSGDEVLHLPTIVENAVASPQAAAAAALQIRKFLKMDNNRPHITYNSIMLIRILADNPGPAFTKCIDEKFTAAVKKILRDGRDPSVHQILRETLDALEREKAYDTNLNTLFAMWRKEAGVVQWQSHPAAPRNPPSQSSGGHRSKSLPAPAELSARIEEARTSAKLLLQLVQSTPPNELLHNDLIEEFAERCSGAQRSIQGYIKAKNPGPDDDTMLTLIETNEQLSLAASKHQRAVLSARRAMGLSPSPVPTPPVNGQPTSNVNQPLPAVPLGDQATARAPDAPQLPPVVSSPPLAQPIPQPYTQNPPPALQSAPQTAAAPPPQLTSNTRTGPPTEDPFSDEHMYAPAGARPAQPQATAEPTFDYTEPYHPGYQANGEQRGFDGYAQPDGRESSATAAGEVSPIEQRHGNAPGTAVGAGGVTYRY